MIHCNPLAVFGLQLVGNILVLNVDHAGNHMLASTNCGLYGKVSDQPQCKVCGHLTCAGHCAAYAVHATWHVLHSTALQSTTSARQCSFVGTLSYMDSLLVP